MRRLISVLCNAVALWVATRVVPGFDVVDPAAHGSQRYADHLPPADPIGWAVTPGQVFVFLWIGAVFALVGGLVRPVATFATLPLRLVLGGAVGLIVSAGVLWLTAWASLEATRLPLVGPALPLVTFGFYEQLPGPWGFLLPLVAAAAVLTVVGMVLRLVLRFR